MRVVLLFAVIAVSLGCAGCRTSFIEYARAEEIVVSPTLPHARFDAEASEVEVTGNPPPSDAGGPRNPEFAERIRKELAEVLSESFNSDAKDALPARFLLRAHLDGTSWPLGPCLFVLGLFGCPIGVGTAKVDLVIEIGGKRFQSSVESEVVAGQYYNTSTSGVPETALADATMEAVRQLKPVRTAK